MVFESELESPRLRHLEIELEAGNHEALDVFWQEIESKGTPLFEPVEGDSEHLLATFLYKGDRSTENVLLRCAIIKADEPKDTLMKRLPYTHLWYRTEKVRTDVVTTYSIAPNDSLVPLSELKTDEEWVKRFVEMAKPDPLNSLTFDLAEGMFDPELCFSILRGLKAAPQPHVEERSGIPHGKVEKTVFKSRVLDNERRIWIYTPPGYKKNGHKPSHLLLTFDGRAYTTAIPTPTVLDNLLSEGRIPPTVAVMIDNVKGSRDKELPPNEKVPKFLRDELIPWIRENYNVTDDPAQTVIAGCSYGGLAAAWNAYQHPDIFGNVLSQSGSYWWNPAVNEPDNPAADAEAGWLIRQFVESERLPLAFYIDVGLLENFDGQKLGRSHQSMNRHMRDVLRAKGYPVTYVEYSGGHDLVWWRQTLADGLITLLETANKGPRMKKK